MIVLGFVNMFLPGVGIMIGACIENIPGNFSNLMIIGLL
jgi:hypothetical protein